MFRTLITISVICFVSGGALFLYAEVRYRINIYRISRNYPRLTSLLAQDGLATRMAANRVKCIARHDSVLDIAYKDGNVLSANVPSRAGSDSSESAFTYRLSLEAPGMITYTGDTTPPSWSDADFVSMVRKDLDFAARAVKKAAKRRRQFVPPGQF